MGRIFLLFVISSQLFASPVSRRICHDLNQNDFLYAEIKAGENLIDIRGETVELYSNRRMDGKPVAYIDAINGFTLPNDNRKELMRVLTQEWAENYIANEDSFVKIVQPDLPLVYAQISQDHNCYNPYLKFELIIPGGFKVRIGTKDYYVKDPPDPSMPLLFYLNEEVEKAGVRQLEKEKSFVETFDKIREAFLTRNAKLLRTLMLPEAEDDIRKVYSERRIEPLYFDFFWTFACNPKNFKKVPTNKNSVWSCDDFKISFPFVMYRPWDNHWPIDGKSSGHTLYLDDVVYITFTGSSVEQGLILVRDGITWKIKSIFLTNSSTSTGYSRPSFWGRETNGLLTYWYEGGADEPWSRSWNPEYKEESE